MNNLLIKLVENKDELNQTLEIRKQVFIKEQNVPVELEIDGLDSEAVHVIVYLENKPVGCARIRTNKYIRLERIAILKEHRGKGFGEKLTEFLINYCRSKNYNEIRLHSQTYIAGFYKKQGFRPIGETFLEADIEHVEMHMKIR